MGQGCHTLRSTNDRVYPRMLAIMTAVMQADLIGRGRDAVEARGDATVVQHRRRRRTVSSSEFTY